MIDGEGLAGGSVEVPGEAADVSALSSPDDDTPESSEATDEVTLLSRYSLSGVSVSLCGFKDTTTVVGELVSSGELGCFINDEERSNGESETRTMVFCMEEEGMETTLMTGFDGDRGVTHGGKF